MTSIRGTIHGEFSRLLRDAEADPSIISDDLELLKSGVDSLAFAVLVATLEDKLGYDPFRMSPEPYYPVTFGDFVAFYEKYSGTDG